MVHGILIQNSFCPGLHSIRHGWRREAQQQGVCQRDEAEGDERTGEAQGHRCVPHPVQRPQVRQRLQARHHGGCEEDGVKSLFCQIYQVLLFGSVRSLSGGILCLSFRS